MKERLAIYSGELESNKDVAQSSYNVLASLGGGGAQPVMNFQDYNPMNDAFIQYSGLNTPPDSQLAQMRGLDKFGMSYFTNKTQGSANEAHIAVRVLKSSQETKKS